MKLICIAIKIDLYEKMQPFKVFLAFNKIVICIYVHLCLERETFQKQTRY